MPELRWNPILRRWNIISDKRQDRPVLPEDSCPLCPGVLEVPQDDYYIVTFENRFPALERDPEEPNLEGDSLYKVRENRGVCEVILYSSDHDVPPAELSLDRLDDLVTVWRDRFADLSKEEFIDYVYIFENRGREIGVTLDHPHGQLYAFPFVPPLPRRSLENARKHYEEKDECLFCRVMEKEKEFGERIIWQNEDFLAFVPFYARFPYEVHLYPRRHFQTMLSLKEGEERSLAQGIKTVLNKYRNLFPIEDFPYITSFHQAPVDDRDYSHYHFHLEFYSLQRGKDKIKYRAGVETGTNAFISSLSPEKMAEDLKETSPESGVNR
ncbi:galactose-1-phosphate uridylyltransferase [Candidatus Bipolaricaulota bacterium]|nr:galactose-1-phosphate uridylyltransferase [Candidatus Bipolaricaulota bacterium]